jgi:hypothetical protein
VVRIGCARRAPHVRPDGCPANKRAV